MECGNLRHTPMRLSLLAVNAKSLKLYRDRYGLSGATDQRGFPQGIIAISESIQVGLYSSGGSLVQQRPAELFSLIRTRAYLRLSVLRK